MKIDPELVIALAEARGECPAPYDFVVEAINRIDQGDEPICRLHTGNVSLYEVHQIALRLHRERIRTRRSRMDAAVRSVMQAAEARGEKPAPREFIERAIERVLSGVAEEGGCRYPLGHPDPGRLHELACNIYRKSTGEEVS